MHTSGNASDDTVTQFMNQCKKEEFTFTDHSLSTPFPESTADSMVTKWCINFSNAPTPSKKRVKLSLQSSSPPPSLQFDPSDIPDFTAESHSPSNVFDVPGWGEMETWEGDRAEVETTEPGKKVVSASDSGTKAPVLKQQKMTLFWRKATEEEKNEHNYHTFQQLREETEFREAERAWAAHQHKKRIRVQNKESQQRSHARKRVEKIADGWEPRKKQKVRNTLTSLLFANLTYFFSEQLRFKKMMTCNQFPRISSHVNSTRRIRES
jgi:hypothetical protein